MEKVVIKIPNNDNLEFEKKAYNAMINTLTVIDEPSFVLKTVLWIERRIQALNAIKCLMRFFAVKEFKRVLENLLEIVRKQYQ